jgi:hypothetical protein
VLATGSNTLLRCRGTNVVPLLLSQEDILNWFIPALVKSSVGSLAGTNEELFTIR